MGRTAEGTFTDQTWAPPVFSVDENGKVIGLTNDNVPNNWGRWGDQDQRGTANFITPDVVSAAAGLIRSGKSISLAVPLDSTGPVHPTRPNVVHFFGYSGADWTVGTELGRVAPGFQAPTTTSSCRCRAAPNGTVWPISSAPTPCTTGSGWATSKAWPGRRSARSAISRTR